MIAPSARTVVVAAAAAALTATAAFGQQLANLESDRAAYLQTHCGHVRDANLQVGCMAEKSIEFSRAQTALAKQRIEASDKRIEQTDRRIEEHKLAIAESRCSIEVADGLKSGDARFRPERGKAILNGKRPSEFGWCRFLEELRKS